MNNNTEITPFFFKDHAVRTTIINGIPRFCLKDVCDIFEIANNRDAASRLHDDEKITVGNTDGNPRGGVPHSLVFITEPGLYRLSFSSRKKEAQVFTRWVFHEVLPAIRRTGCYAPSHVAYLSLVREQIALGVSPDLAARCAARITPVADRAALAPHAAPKAAAPIDPLEAHVPLLLSLMQPGEVVGTLELRARLPEGHPYRTKKLELDRQLIGYAMKRASAAGHIDRINGRHIGYRLANPANIVSI